MKRLIDAFLLFLCSFGISYSVDFYKVTLPDGNVIKAEVAEDKAKGLQQREHLCSDCGMIFIFEKEGKHSFWMKDTLINLTLIWMDKEGKVVHIVNNAEPCRYQTDPYKECEIYSPGSDAKYVLEILPQIDKSIGVGSVLTVEKSH